jgi:hypothetical protein
MPVARRGEVRSVVGENGVDFVRNDGNEFLQKVSRNLTGCRLVKLYEDKLGRAINGNKHVELALLSAHFGDIDMKVADRIVFEFLFIRGVFRIR